MKNLNFLLIDDSKSTNFFNKVIIEKTTSLQEIKAVENGAEAIKVLNSSYVPEIIFLDINMPVMNGWEFLMEFQKLDDNYKNCMIILMIGTELPSGKEKFIQSIPEIKGRQEKMLSKEIVLDIVNQYYKSKPINLENPEVPA